MHVTMRRNRIGSLVYYTCDALHVPHAFTTKFGGVSTGDCESLNLGFGRGDLQENVRENYRILSNALEIPFENVTMTKQVHEADVSIVTPAQVGMGLHQKITWESDAIVTALSDVPLVGFYADCVVTLLYDAQKQTVGVCHSGWRGTAKNILGNTVDAMVARLGSKRESIVAVIGPSIRQDCFETDRDVPDAMHEMMGDMVNPYIARKESKFHVDLQGINARLLQQVGLREANIIDSGICTMCAHDEFWSHRVTNGKRGVQAGIICMPNREESHPCK